MREGTTNARAVPRFAWSLWALSVVLTVFALLLLVLNMNHQGVPVDSFPAGQAMAWVSSWILPPEHASLWLRDQVKDAAEESRS